MHGHLIRDGNKKKLNGEIDLPVPWRWQGKAKVNGGIDVQSTFTCSKLTIETVEQGVKYVQS